MSKKRSFFIGVLSGFLFFYLSAFIFGGIIGFDLILNFMPDSRLVLLVAGAVYSLIASVVLYSFLFLRGLHVNKYSLLFFAVGFFIPYLSILIGSGIAIQNSSWF